MPHNNGSNLNPARFLSLPKEQAEESFNNLSVLEQIQTCLLSPWEKRLEFFLLSRNTSEIIQNFPEEELFWTIKSLSPDDALLILPHVKAEQLQFFFDIEWWRKQDLRLEAIASWLLLLFEAEEKIISNWLHWISKEDDAILPLILRQFIMVQKKPDDMDIMEAKDTLYGYTIDDTFFINFKSEKLAWLFDRFLRILFEFSSEYYFGVMDSILWETNIEQLERAYKNRNGRLADFGIPDYYEAIEILTPPPFGAVRKIDRRVYSKSLIYDDYSPPFMPTIYKGDFPALNQALAPLFGKNAMERIINEWVGAANKLMISTLEDFDDPQMMEKTLLGTASLLNLGIILQNEIEEKKSFSEILEDCALEDLIRLSIMRLLKIRKKINSLVKEGLLPSDLNYLPDLWQDVIKSLRKKIPMYFDGKEESFFSNMKQIEEYEDFIEDIHVWAKIMANVNPIWSKWNFSIDFKGTNFPNPYEFLWHKGLLTAFANVSLYGVFKIMPIPEFELTHLKEMWFPKTDKTPENTLELGFKTLEHIAKKYGLSEERVKRIVFDCFEELRYEWENISSDATHIDGRFTSSLLVKLSKGRDK